MARRTPSVVLAVRRDLRELEQVKAGISRGGLAAAALALAREIDDAGNTASGIASCVARLDELLAELRLMARRAGPVTNTPTETPRDGLDELNSRRAARRSGT